MDPGNHLEGIKLEATTSVIKYCRETYENGTTSPKFMLSIARSKMKALRIEINHLNEKKKALEDELQNLTAEEEEHEKAIEEAAIKFNKTMQGLVDVLKEE